MKEKTKNLGLIFAGLGFLGMANWINQSYNQNTNLDCLEKMNQSKKYEFRYAEDRQTVDTFFFEYSKIDVNCDGDPEAEYWSIYLNDLPIVFEHKDKHYIDYLMDGYNGNEMTCETLEICLNEAVSFWKNRKEANYLGKNIKNRLKTG